MNTTYHRLLEEAGFDDKKIKIYLTALELCSAPASAISSRSGIKRTTTYGILEELVRDGLSSKTEKSKVVHFVVDNPDLLRTYVKRQKDKYADLENKFSAAIPEMKKLQREYSFRPEVEYFEGAPGVVAAFESVLPDIKKMAKNDIPLFVHGQTGKLLEVWPRFTSYAKKRKKTGVKIKMLTSSKESSEEMIELHKNHYQIKKLPEKYAYTTATNILEDKIIFFDYDNLFTAIVKSKALTMMMRKFFEFTWDMLK